MKIHAKILLGIMTVWVGCVDKVNLSLPATDLPVIIEGLVTDESGPDTIKLTQAYPVDGSFYERRPIIGAHVVISDNVGTEDALMDITNGYYITQTLQGKIGRTYTLKVTLSDGTTFESSPETMAPAGSIDSIYSEYTSTFNKEKNIEEDGFNIYLNGSVDPSSSRRLRWKYNGTYQIFTNPAAIVIHIPCPEVVCPTMSLACAEGCQCCTCFVYEREKSPLVTNPTFLGGNQFAHQFIHYIPINNYTFNEKYRVEITQMEVSQLVYDFYNALRKQIENASSLFQPPFFELNGNMKAVNSKARVVGIFSAAAVTKKYIYLTPADIPYTFFSTEIIGDCRAVVEHSTTVVPPFWE